MLKLVNIKRLAIIISVIAIMFLVASTWVSFGTGVLLFAIFHTLLSISFINPTIAELFLGNKLSEKQKANLRRIGLSTVFLAILIIINCTYLGLAIYILIELGGFKLIDLIK
jgi:hypothetical protein